MTETLPTTLLSSLSEFLSNQMGIYFPPHRGVDLERGIRAAAGEFGFADPERCAEWLLGSPPLTQQQVETLASQLTVGETYFFREKPSFEALETHVLPELIRARAAERRLRIWSAGCATGEEPYSLAILLARLIPNLVEWNISILGTDLNPLALQKAAAGAYTAWSFRDCPPEFADRYFAKSNPRRWEISPEIQKMVVFSYLNLVEEIYPSLLNDTNAVDIILCRNVLMYFCPEQARRVVARFHRCLVEGGWLAVSATETSHILYPQFSTVNFSGAVLYRKEESRNSKFETGNLPAGGSSGKFVVSNWDARPDRTSKIAAPGSPFAAVSVELPVSSFDFHPAAGEAAAPGLATGDSDFAARPATPENARGMAERARTLADQGELAEALAWCDKALAMEKLEAGFHYLRATILQEQDAPDAAAHSLKRAIYLNHGFILAHFALGNLQRLHGRGGEAKKHFQNALALLHGYPQEQVLPESEGITAGRLREVIERCLVRD